MSETVATVIGYILFAISEILPFINVPTSGILHTLTLGFKSAFTNPTKDIEMAESLVNSDPSFANIVNTISTNPQIKTLVDAVIKDPSLANLFHSARDNVVISSQLTTVLSNPQLQTIVNILTQNPEFCNNVSALSANPLLINYIMNTMQNKQLITVLNNPSTLSALTALSQNTTLIPLLPYMNPQITTTLQEVISTPQLSNALAVLSNLADKQKILDILSAITMNPNSTLLSNINGLVQSSPRDHPNDVV